MNAPTNPTPFRTPWAATNLVRSLLSPTACAIAGCVMSLALPSPVLP